MLPIVPMLSVARRRFLSRALALGEPN